MGKPSSLEMWLRESAFKGRKPKIASSVWSLAVIGVLLFLIARR